MPLETTDMVQMMETFVEATLDSTGTLRAPTYNQSRGTYGPPYTNAALNVPCDILRGNPFSQNAQSIAQRFNIALTAYRVITLPKWVLTQYPAIGRTEDTGEWRFVHGGFEYVLLEANSADETEPIMAQFHASLVGAAT